MANYFSDNQDIKFLLDYFDLKEIAAMQERETPNGDADYAPRDPSNRRRFALLTSLVFDKIAFFVKKGAESRKKTPLRGKLGYYKTDK